MKTPLILVEEQDVNFFSSAAALERYVESPDIACYQVFDAAGEVLRLAADASPPEKKVCFGHVAVYRVKLSCTDPPRFAAGELTRILSEYLKRLTSQPSTNAELDDLIREIAKHVNIED